MALRDDGDDLDDEQLPPEVTLAELLRRGHESISTLLDSSQQEHINVVFGPYRAGNRMIARASHAATMV